MFRKGKAILQDRLRRRHPDKLNKMYLDQYFKSSDTDRGAGAVEPENKVSQRPN